MQPHLETPQLKLRIIHDYQIAKGTRRHLNFTEVIRNSHMEHLITFGEENRSNWGAGGDKKQKQLGKKTHH